MADERIQLTRDGHIAVITNNNPAKHNAFDDEMDFALFEILDEIKADKSIRAVVWRGEGKSWSSGRDVAAIGANRWIWPTTPSWSEARGASNNCGRSTPR